MADVNKSEEIRKVANDMLLKGEKPRPVLIIAELKKKNITVSSPAVSMVLKRMGLKTKKRAKAGSAPRKAGVAKRAPVSPASKAVISLDDLLAAKKVAAQLGGTDRALEALAALKRIES